jgi:hypothetical protein
MQKKTKKCNHLQHWSTRIATSIQAKLLHDYILYHKKTVHKNKKNANRLQPWGTRIATSISSKLL